MVGSVLGEPPVPVGSGGGCGSLFGLTQSQCNHLHHQASEFAEVDEIEESDRALAAVWSLLHAVANGMRVVPRAPTTSRRAPLREGDELMASFDSRIGAVFAKKRTRPDATVRLRKY